MAPRKVPKSVLIVDDSPMLLHGMARTLLKEGHKVGTAGYGEEGLRMFREKEWDVVITALRLPHMNGEEMTAAIKAEAPTIPVIAITDGAGSVQNPSAFYALVTTPFHEHELLELVNNALQK